MFTFKYPLLTVYYEYFRVNVHEYHLYFIVLRVEYNFSSNFFILFFSVDNVSGKKVKRNNQQDFSLFVPDAPTYSKISPQLSFAIFQYLTTCKCQIICFWTKILITKITTSDTIWLNIYVFLYPEFFKSGILEVKRVPSVNRTTLAQLTKNSKLSNTLLVLRRPEEFAEPRY